MFLGMHCLPHLILKEMTPGMRCLMPRVEAPFRNQMLLLSDFSWFLMVSLPQISPLSPLFNPLAQLPLGACSLQRSCLTQGAGLLAHLKSTKLSRHKEGDSPLPGAWCQPHVAPAKLTDPLPAFQARHPLQCPDLSISFLLPFPSPQQNP